MLLLDRFQLSFEKTTLVSSKDQDVFTWLNLDFQMYLFCPGSFYRILRVSHIRSFFAYFHFCFPIRSFSSFRSEKRNKCLSCCWKINVFKYEWGILFMTLILFFINDFDSGISLHSNWGLELVNRPRDTKGKVRLMPNVVCSIA